MKRILTMAELQDELHLSRAFAYQLAHSSGFPSFRIGKKLLIDGDGLEEWIKRGGTANEAD